MPLCSFRSLCCCAAKQDVEVEKQDQNFLESTFDDFFSSEEDKDNVFIKRKVTQLCAKNKKGTQMERFNREEERTKGFEEVKSYPFFRSKTTAVLDQESRLGIFHTVLEVKTTSQTCVSAVKFVGEELEQIAEWSEAMYKLSSSSNRANSANQEENKQREGGASPEETTHNEDNAVAIASCSTNLGFSEEDVNIEGPVFKVVSNPEEEDSVSV